MILMFRRPEWKASVRCQRSFQTLPRFAEAFRERLEKKAGFKFVPKPMPMKTKTNSIIYYLYFASQKEAGMDIVNDIFSKYREKQGL